MNILQIENDLSNLTDEFSDLNFQLFKSDNKNIDYINCLVCHISLDLFINQWEQIMNVTAAKFQTSLSSQLEYWNTYLIFCLDAEPSTEIKYNVENDTFFMRKLVTNRNNWSADDGIQDFISKEIFCTDLKLNSLDNHTTSTESSTYENSCLSTEFLSLEICKKDNLETELSNLVNNIVTRDATNED